MKKLMFLAMVLLISAIVIIQGLLMIAKADTHFICAVTKGEWVWLRTMPDKDADTVYGKDDFRSKIRYGTEGEIHEISNLYARITTTDGREGWVDVSYLLMPIREEIWTITTEGPLNKRETPRGRYLTNIAGGSRISVLGWRYDNNGELWAHVYHGGYVKAQYLAKAE